MKKTTEKDGARMRDKMWFRWLVKAAATVGAVLAIYLLAFWTVIQIVPNLVLSLYVTSPMNLAEGGDAVSFAAWKAPAMLAVILLAALVLVVSRWIWRARRRTVLWADRMGPLEFDNIKPGSATAPMGAARTTGSKTKRSGGR